MWFDFRFQACGQLGDRFFIFCLTGDPKPPKISVLLVADPGICGFRGFRDTSAIASSLWETTQGT